MNATPSNITGSRLSQALAGEPTAQSALGRIAEGGRPIRRLAWPGSDIEAGIVVLTAEEIEESVIAAAERLRNVREIMGDIVYHERLTIEVDLQIIWRSVLDPETGAPWAKSPDEMRSMLPVDVVDYLVGIYNDWQRVSSPLFALKITEAEADQIITALRTDPAGKVLRGIEPAELRFILQRVATLAAAAEAK